MQGNGKITTSVTKIVFVLAFVFSTFLLLGMWFKLYFSLIYALEDRSTLDLTEYIFPFLFAVYNTLLHLWLGSQIIKKSGKYLLLLFILMGNYVLINIFWQLGIM